MAVDAQGADKALPFVEGAGATFPTVVDRNNLLSRIFGFKAIPNAIFIDEDGVIRYLKYSGFDIIKAEYRRIADAWAATGETPQQGSPQDANVTGSGSSHSEAVRLFDEGMDMYNAGQVEKALVLWKKGVALEPDNFVIRKQIWAVEHPDRFYEGDVDYDWQNEQIARGL